MSLPVRLPESHRLPAVLCASVAFWLVGSPTLADDQAPPVVELPPVVISATRLPTPEEQLGSSVTVITSEDIARKQERALPDVLADEPGLNVVQEGGPGGQTSVFIRGTDSNHSKVFIDGIDASDPSSPNGAFDFSQILASDIERVEVLRGPQSGLYGSDAIGGVINIITRKGSGPAQFRGSVEGGSFGTFNQTAGVSGSVARLNYAFDYTDFQTADSHVTPANLVPPGRPVNSDFSDNKTYATRLGAELTDTLDVGLVARYVDTRLRSTADDYLGPEAIPSASDNHELFTRATAHLALFDGAFDQTVGVGYTDYRRRYLDPNYIPAAPSFSRGDRVKFDWQGNITLMPGQVLTLGAEHQLDEMHDPVHAKMNNDAGFAQLQSSFAERFFNTISVRYDDNDRFGSRATFRIAPAVLIPETGTRLKASVGTGFKAPTLDELFDNYPEYDFYANPNLKPETSVGYDFGFEQALLDRRVQFGATYFHNNIWNLIGINETATSYANVGRATTYGVESFLSCKPAPSLTLRGDYTYTHAEDDILHQELLRRPKDKASLNGTWQVTGKASLSATLLYVGPWVDANRAGTVSGLTTDGYAIVNLAGSYDLGHGLTAFARIDNLLERRYQNPTGFLRPGFGVFGGLRVAFANPD
jgi:vitamin B12 transporter